MNMQRLVLFATSIALFSAGFIFNSCGGDKNNGMLIIHQDSETISMDQDIQANIVDPDIQANSTTDDAGSSSVAIYVTGERSKFKEMIVTIERIELVSTGTGSSCEVLSYPSTINFGDLANKMQFLNATDCSGDIYDKIHVELVNSLDLTSVSPKTGLLASMSCPFFSSYKQESAGRLQCNGPLCSFDMDLEVKVPAPDGNKLVLGFNTSELDIVNVNETALCGVTMKITPFHYDGAMQGYMEGITGLVSDLTPTDHRFSLVRVNSVFTVDYQQVSDEHQPGLDALLAFAENESLRVKVMTPEIAFIGGTIAATDVFVKMEGIISNLDLQARTFTVGTLNQTILVDYSTAAIHGSLADGSLAVMRMYGYDGLHYLASKVDTDLSAPDG